MNLPPVIPRFFAWWLSELRACVPAPLRRLFGRGQRRLFIVLREGSTDFIDEGRGSERVLSRAAANSDLRANQRKLADLPALRGPWSDILAVIPPERALNRRLQLPAAVAENLSESMGFEIDRLTPFQAAEVVYQTRLVSIDRRLGQLTCDVWVVPRAAVEEALRRVNALGFRPDRIGISAPGGAEPSFIELPAALGGRLGRWMSWRLPAALLASAAVLALAGFLLHLDRKDQILAAYAQESAKYRGAAAEAAKLRENIRSLAETQAAASKRRREVPLFVDVLAEVTARLPDDTWLSELKLGDGHVLLTGYASSAAALVSVIENSPLFQNARLSGPVIPDPQLKREQFSIDAELSPKAGP